MFNELTWEKLHDLENKLNCSRKTYLYLKIYKWSKILRIFLRNSSGNLKRFHLIIQNVWFGLTDKLRKHIYCHHKSQNFCKCPVLTINLLKFVPSFGKESLLKISTLFLNANPKVSLYCGFLICSNDSLCKCSSIT